MHNLLCVMTRREEGYHRTLREHEQERRWHEALAAQRNTTDPAEASTEPASPHTTIRTKEADLDRYLVFDRYRRNSLIDHFLAPSATLQEFANVEFEEQGNFVELPYTAEVQQDQQGITITLTRDGYVRRAGGLGPIPVRLSKTLFLPLGEEKLIVRYTIQNNGLARLQTRFASEWNFNLLGGGGNDQAYYRIAGQEPKTSLFETTGEFTDVQQLHIGNNWLRQDIGFTLSQAATLWRFSIDTVTGSEAGFERTHQGSCLTLLWPILLEAGDRWTVEITCTGKEI
jgi:alpha-amylase